MKLKRFFYLLPFVILFFIVPSKAAAAARFYLSPSSGSYKVGATVSASVMIDSGGQAINSGEGSVSYSSDILEYQSVSTGGSIFTFWTSGPSGSSSSVSFGGGLSTPGYTGSGGKVLTITWKIKKAGTASVTMHGSQILANDGNGTNIYGSSSGATFTTSVTATPTPTINAPTVRSTTHPDQAKWYNASTVALSWSASSSSGYSFVFDQAAASNPPDAPTVATTSQTYSGVADGVWYFHVKAKVASGFTPTAHYKIQIDTKEPDIFTVTVHQDGGLTNPRPTVTFEASDTTSGIDRYEATIDEGTAFSIKSGDALPKQSPGDHTVTIKAFDKAGNARAASATYKIQGLTPPVITEWTKKAGLLGTITFVGRSSSTDTIHVYIDDKEVAHFLSKDKQVAPEALSAQSRVVAGFSDEVAWQYDFADPLLPGPHVFRFSRTDAAGADSERTQPYSVSVLASTIKIAGHLLPTSYVLTGLLVFIFLLLIIIAYLMTKIRAIARRCGQGIAFVGKNIKRLFSRTEKELDRNVDETIPNHELNAADVRDIKRRLKDEIHHTIEQEEKNQR